MSELDGSDIVYTARVPVAKIIALSVHIGTRFPATSTSMGMVMLADLSTAQLDRALMIAPTSTVVPRVQLTRKQIDISLAKSANKAGHFPMKLSHLASGRWPRQFATPEVKPSPQLTSQ